MTAEPRETGQVGGADAARSGRVALGIIFLTVFVDLIGFGIVLPLLPFYATELGANTLEVGAIIASYSAMQFLFSPVWGRMSDRHGRRPMLLIGLVGSGAGYLLFGLAGSVPVLLASRVVAGAMGANIPVAQAFIADTTTGRARARGMGLIGAAFGLGFILGPALGGFLSQWGYAVPGFAAAGLSFANAIVASVRLPESLPPERRASAVPARHGALAQRLEDVRTTLQRPELHRPILAFFLATVGFAAYTTTFPLFLDRILGMEAVHAGWMFAFIGLVTASVQGRLIGPLVSRFGERHVAAAGAALLGLGLELLSRVHGLGWTLALLVPIGGGWGMLAPSIQGLISRRAAAGEQGVVLGVNQSMSSLARVLGPIAGGWWFGAFGFQSEFLAAGAPLLVAAGWMLFAVSARTLKSAG